MGPFVHLASEAQYHQCDLISGPPIVVACRPAVGPIFVAQLDIIRFSG